MIDHKLRQNRDLALIQIWTRLKVDEKERVMALFPSAKSIEDPEVKEYIFRTFRDKLIEVVVK